MRTGAWLFVVLLLSCKPSKKPTEFLGLILGEKLPKSGKKADPPMLAMDFEPYYEIEHPNMVFSHVGVAITENSDQLIGSIKKKYDVTLVKETALKPDKFEKWSTYYSKNVLWSVICSGNTFSVKIRDLGVLAKVSTATGEDNPFQFNKMAGPKGRISNLVPH